MYPVLFRIGSFEITSFGAMTALGALIGLWILARELRFSNLPSRAIDAGTAGVVGGLLGAKLLYVIEHLNEMPLIDLLTDRAGLSWYGGLILGITAGLVTMRVIRVPIVAVLAAATPALAIGHLVGRIGCFLVGDDYGRPTDLPWGVAFPEGLPPTTVPVHPTQLYEAAFLGVLAALLIRWRRHGTPDRVVLGRYLVLAGSARFLIEFVRINVRLALGLTMAQWLSITVVIAGVLLMVMRASVARSAEARSR